MEIVLYLAMTAAEFRETNGTYPHTAWMACHFSPYSTGLSNLPLQLPKGSLLILNDRTPVFGHSPERIARQLEEAAAQLECSGILLDFQRPGEPEVQAIAAAVAALPCPIAVTPQYAQGLECAVFLPPVPLTTLLPEYLAPWQGREIWLEAATDNECIRVSKDGSRQIPHEETDLPYPHVDRNLHCKYRMEVQEDHIDFHLRRDKEQLLELIEEANRLGVSRFVGLYQQLGVSFSQATAQEMARFQS